MRQFNNYAEYLDAKGKLDLNSKVAEEWMKANKTRGIPNEIVATFPFANEVNNDLRSAIELWEFMNDIPQSYFLYISEERKEATTWTGQKLGNVHFGREYKDNFGGKRQPIDVYAVNGKKYHGTFYKSAGDYARIKLYKNQSLTPIN